MEKTVKITVKYRDGILPDGLDDILQNADEGDLRILVLMLMMADKETGSLSLDELYDRAGVECSDVDASLKYWRGAGIIGRVSVSKGVKAEKAEKAEKSEKAEKVPKIESVEKDGQKSETAHRNGALERSGSLQNYSSAELAELMEKRKMSAQFVDEAQRVMGKLFRTYDTGILMGIVDQLGFEEEAVLAILAYTVRKGKKTMRYAEQIAIALYDDGITSTADVTERIHRIEMADEIIGKIRTLFGIGDRALTANEKKLFATWTEKYVYDLDVIRMAYDITVDTIQKPVPKYAASILEKWHTEGLRTAEDVRKYIESQSKDQSDSSGVVKSYDVEDFFEAALRRSYEEMK